MQSKDAATHNSPAAKQWGCLFLTQKVRRAKVRGNKFMKLERGKLRRQGVLLYLAAFSMIVVLIIAIMGGYLYRFYHRTIYENFVE